MHVNRNKFDAFGHKSAFVLSITISIILIIIMLISFLYAQMRNHGRGLHILDIISISWAVTFLLNTLLLYILFRFQFWAIKKHQNPRRRTFTAIFGSLFLLLILSPSFSNIQWWVLTEQMPNNAFTTLRFTIDLILLLITLLFTALMYTWTIRQKTVVENQQLLVENLQNRYDALKSQIDPHFLFNSLNTLNGLIGYDDDKAHEYVDQLSSVFRYTMQNKPMITLAEELEFAESYTYLMKIRYNESLTIEYRTEEKYLSYHILPFGLQILLENAIKHNIVSNKHPLLITIETTGDDRIKVWNNLQLKPDQVNTSGVGLANLNERYQLMFGQEIQIAQDDTCFSVEIPLIKEADKIKFNSIISNHHESCYC